MSSTLTGFWVVKSLASSAVILAVARKVKLSLVAIVESSVRTEFGTATLSNCFLMLASSFDVTPLGGYIPYMLIMPEAVADAVLDSVDDGERVQLELILVGLLCGRSDDSERVKLESILVELLCAERDDAECVKLGILLAALLCADFF